MLRNARIQFSGFAEMVFPECFQRKRDGMQYEAQRNPGTSTVLCSRKAMDLFRSTQTPVTQVFDAAFFLRKIWSLPLVGAADIEEFGRVTSTSLPACGILQFAVAMEIPEVISITPPPIFLYDWSQQHRTKEQPRYSLRSIFKDHPVQNLRRFACPSPLRQFFPECPG